MVKLVREYLPQKRKGPKDPKGVIHHKGTKIRKFA